MREANQERFDNIMAPDQGFVAEWLNQPTAVAMQTARDKILKGSRREVPAPWKGRFSALGLVPDFQRIEIRAMKPWVDLARKVFADLGLRSERGIAFVYDTII